MDLRKFISKTGNKIAKQHQMNVIGTMTDDRDGVVGGLGLDFQTVGPLTQEQLRCLLVDIVEYLLLAINSNQKLAPYLRPNPFSVNELEVAVFITDKRGAGLSAPDLVLGRTFDDSLIYSTMDRSGQYPKVENLVREPYSTALEIVKQGGCKGAP
jgi:hypothetical protein